jgi:light-regulated signal transduction histidine kinase (bacteriophytochrome)
MNVQQIANLGAYMQFNRKIYEQQGSGLGLILAKRLAELHGGQLTIQTHIPHPKLSHPRNCDCLSGSQGKLVNN